MTLSNHFSKVNYTWSALLMKQLTGLIKAIIRENFYANMQDVGTELITTTATLIIDNRNTEENLKNNKQHLTETTYRHNVHELVKKCRLKRNAVMYCCAVTVVTINTSSTDFVFNFKNWIWALTAALTRTRFRPKLVDSWALYSWCMMQFTVQIHKVCWKSFREEYMNNRGEIIYHFLLLGMRISDNFCNCINFSFILHYLIKTTYYKSWTSVLSKSLAFLLEFY